MATKSFFQVLEEQIRADLREELLAELTSELPFAQKTEPPAESTLADYNPPTWLLLKLDKSLGKKLEDTPFVNPQMKAHTAYRTSARARGRDPLSRDSGKPSQQREQKRSAPERVSPFAIEDVLACELLKRKSGSDLPHLFSEAELKAVWKRAALKTHPDRFPNAKANEAAEAAAIFRELADAYSRLLRLFTPRQNQGAASTQQAS